MTLKIGLDLDNTIINYDRAFLVAATERGLIPTDFKGTKQQIRDHIRALGNDGETKWQKLQGFVYGKGIMQAEIFSGVFAFLAQAKSQKAELAVVSHKTRFGHFDEDKVDLRQAALAFLETQNIFSYIPKERIFFFSTRDEKIAKIKDLACDVFVDDLEEVFNDPQFPATTRKLLFTTSSHPQPFESLSSWSLIEQAVFTDDKVKIAASILGSKIDSVTLAGGGGNSRIYRVASGDKYYALKMYPTSANDKRDRLGVEKKTLQFFARHKINCVPQWLGDAPGFGCLSWVEGPLANPPADQEIEDAANFIESIKQASDAADADAFSPASEACTSAAEIIHQIERRLKRLQVVAETEPALQQFLNNIFQPSLNRALHGVKTEYAKQQKPFDTALQKGLCLIPADFGFHNAIRTGKGLVFIDFEYFGWDDPVKLAADFLLHPAMELSPEAQKRFKNRMIAIFADDPYFAWRLKLHTPLFALRWALILLNEFLPERWSGRAFARAEDAWTAAKERQLKKAEKMLKNSVHEDIHA